MREGCTQHYAKNRCARLIWRQGFGAFLRALAFLTLGAMTVTGADRAIAQESAVETPQQIQDLLVLLADPQVRSWIESAAGVAQSPAPADETVRGDAASFLTDRAVAISNHLNDLADAIPRLPEEFSRAYDRFVAELDAKGYTPVLLILAVFVLLGLGLEWLFHQGTKSFRAWIDGRQDKTPAQRCGRLALRLSCYLAGLLIFTLGSAGTSLVFDWPSLLRGILLSYLLAVSLFRLSLTLLRLLLALPDRLFQARASLQVVPASPQGARYWYRRLAWFLGILLFGWVTLSLLTALGFTPAARQIVAYAMGLALVAVAIAAIWRRPRATPLSETSNRTKARLLVSWGLTIYSLLLWFFWFADARPLFCLAVVALALPFLSRLTHRSIHHLVSGGATMPDPGSPPSPSVIVTSLDRALRAALFIGSAFLLAWAWDIDLGTLAAGSSPGERMLRGLLDAVVIALVADFLWHVVKTVIEGKIAAAKASGNALTPEGRRQQRLRTLLPILQNILLVIFVVMTVLMSLSAIGVDIGPLIAGAGVVGVAIGFGAQTLVKDVISGMFYLLDDAFRVGEYIQSGSYKGTVESFSLRSVKLRHHRGPLYTVPFGELGAVQNMSRDWVIEKLTIEVAGDSDLDLARKLVKQISKELMQDPDCAPHILEPLKMQGVDQLLGAAILLRCKVTTLPGEQFVVRRKAYAMIKKAFDANGIRFAVPNVQVSDPKAAVAAQSMLLAQAKKADA